MEAIPTSEYSRVFEEIRRPTMTPSMYKTLEDLKLRSAWEAVSSEIIPGLISDGYFITPYPEEAKDYNLFSVFVKIHKCCCNRILSKGRKYRYATRLQNEVKHVEKDVFTYCENEAYGIPKDYIFDSVGRVTDGEVDKSMLFIMKGTSKLCGELVHIRKNELVISRQNPELGKTKNIYVVNEIIVASSMIIQVSIGDKKKRWEFAGPIPLAFKLLKLRLQSRGHVHGADPANILPRWYDTEPIEWERPSESKRKYLR